MNIGTPRVDALRSGMNAGRALRPTGFTLMELVIVLVIIAILTAVAIPSYTAYIQRSNRSDARNQLMMASQWMERFRNENGRYDNPAIPGTPPALPGQLAQSPFPGTARYNITLATPDAATYTLSAAPVAADVCGTLTINQAGQRDFTVGPGASMDLCWNR